MEELLQEAKNRYPKGTRAFDAKYKRTQPAYPVKNIIISGSDLINERISYIYDGSTGEWAEIESSPENYETYEIY